MDELKDMAPDARSEYLEGLPRASLQKLAKEAGHKANAKSADIIKSLLEALEGPSPPPEQTADPDDRAAEAAVQQGAAAESGGEEKDDGQPSSEQEGVGPPKTGTTQKKKRGRNAGSESAHKPKTTKKAKPEIERMDTVREAGLPKISPVNPAASPEKEPDTAERPPTAAPACQTVLLPTLEEAEDAGTVGVDGEAADEDPLGTVHTPLDGASASLQAPAADAAVHSNPTPASTSKAEEAEQLHPMPADPQSSPLSGGSGLIPLAAPLSTAQSPATESDAAGVAVASPVAVSAFVPQPLDSGAAQKDEPPQEVAAGEGVEMESVLEAAELKLQDGDGAVEEGGGAGVTAAALASVHSNPLAEKDIEPVREPELDRDMTELAQVEALVFGREAAPNTEALSPTITSPAAPVQPIEAEKTPVSAVAAIMEEAQDSEPAQPTTVCDNPFFEDDESNAPGSAAVEAAEGGPSESASGDVSCQGVDSQEPVRGLASTISRLEKDAFERGRKSGLWQGKIEANLGQLEEQLDEFKAGKRAWQLPSMDEVRAQGLKLAASGYTTVATPSLGDKSRQAFQKQRQGTMERKHQPPLNKLPNKMGVRNSGVQKRQSNSSPARSSPFRRGAGPKENTHSVATPSRLARVSKSALLESHTQGSDSEVATGGKAATTPGVKGKLKVAQAERAKKAEANFAARRVAALARAKK